MMLPTLSALLAFIAALFRSRTSLCLEHLVLLQEWPVICYNEPHRFDLRSPETCHERFLPVQMASL